jgi:DNA-binding LacI/PurR family transcriptional regulator
VERLQELHVDGLLLTTSEAPDVDRGIAEWVGGLTVPTVLVERQFALGWSPTAEHVRTDHAAGALLAMRHLARLGHRRVLLAAREHTPTTRWLIEGHAAAITEGLLEPHDGMQPVMLPRPDSHPPENAAALEGLLTSCVETDTRAVLVHNDEDALAVVRLAGARGLRIPEDLAVVAYDDEVAALSDVPLTAIAPPKVEVGRTAVEMIMRRLAGGTAPAAQHLSLLPRLTVRASCGARG